MIRTISSCEHNVHVEPAAVVVVLAATATLVFPDERGKKGEIVSRYLQNGSSNYRLYINFGGLTAAGQAVCDDALTYHVFVEPGQLFDCFPHREAVSVFCREENVKVSTMKMVRYDMAH